MTEHLTFEQAVAELIRENGGEFPVHKRTLREQVMRELKKDA